MMAIPFNPQKDLAPIPFDNRTCKLALELKRLGLPWRPHVGCFVWDPERFISYPSPFPNQIYFILSLPRFLDIFGSTENIEAKLVWLPTWHQAGLLCQKMDVCADDLYQSSQLAKAFSADDGIYQLYEWIAEGLRRHQNV